ncbi:NUDIX hydrolase [Okibacterium endophyticum]
MTDSRGSAAADAAQRDAEPLADTALPVQTVSSERVFDGAVWDVRRESFRYNDETITREYVDHTGAVAVLAMNDDGQVLLIRQYRHPVRMSEWEIPAGLLDVDGEDPLVAAQRELAEEADLVAAEWNVLTDFFTSPGGSNEAIRVYLARGLAAAPEVFAREHEEADIELRWVELDEVVDAVLSRRLQNPSLIVAVFAAHAARARSWVSLGRADEPWQTHPRALKAARGL